MAPGMEVCATLSGSYHLLARPDSERACSLTVRVVTPSLLRLSYARPLDLTGSIYLEGVVHHRAARGHARLREGGVFSELSFYDDAGERYRLEARPVTPTYPAKVVWGLFEIRLFDAAGTAIGKGKLRFDLRGNLARIWRTFHVHLTAATRPSA